MASRRTVLHIAVCSLLSAIVPVRAQQPGKVPVVGADGAAFAPEPVSGRPLLHRARRVLDHRPENRLLHAALRRVLEPSASRLNQHPQAFVHGE